MSDDTKLQEVSEGCHCHLTAGYGFVPEADCPEHDTDLFLKFVEAVQHAAREAGARWMAERLDREGFNNGCGCCSSEILMKETIVAALKELGETKEKTRGPIYGGIIGRGGDGLNHSTEEQGTE